MRPLGENGAEGPGVDPGSRNQGKTTAHCCKDSWMRHAVRPQMLPRLAGAAARSGRVGERGDDWGGQVVGGAAPRPATNWVRRAWGGGPGLSGAGPPHPVRVTTTHLAALAKAEQCGRTGGASGTSKA